jgi:hypothetical protein
VKVLADWELYRWLLESQPRGFNFSDPCKIEPFSRQLSSSALPQYSKVIALLALVASTSTPALVRTSWLYELTTDVWDNDARSKSTTRGTPHPLVVSTTSPSETWEGSSPMRRASSLVRLDLKF